MTDRELFEWKMTATQLATMAAKLSRACDVLEAAARAEKLLAQVRAIGGPIALVASEQCPRARADELVSQGDVSPGKPGVNLPARSGSSSGQDRRPSRSPSAIADGSTQQRAVAQVRALAARAVSGGAAAAGDRADGERSSRPLRF